MNWGVNFFDSANVYERGEGERVMAEALKPFPRESYTGGVRSLRTAGQPRQRSTCLSASF
nr:aldo/keto reductase [Caldalkalibacillus thermarum]